MSAAQLEAFLARIYVDAKARSAFLSDPLGEAARAGLNADEAQSLEKIDFVGLRLASRSFEKKRLRRSRRTFRFPFPSRQK